MRVPSLQTGDDALGLPSTTETAFGMLQPAILDLTDLETDTPSTTVLTKLYPPGLRANVVPRPHLLAWLNRDPAHKLTLICAPAGYGKSTLAAQWTGQLGMPRSWVTFAAADNNPRSFFGLILAALRTIDPGLTAATDALLNQPGPVNARALAHTLIDDLSVTTRPFVMVLDDYHAIVAPELHEAVELLLQHAPSMRVVLLSRTEPPLRLARFRANGELCEIRQRDLIFTDAETGQFFRSAFGLELTPGDLGILQARTEGWVAGLQLVGVALRGNSRENRRQPVVRFASDWRAGDEYLWDQVLQSQPEDIRSFLLRASVLDRFTSGLCEAVTGRPDSDALIRRCERDNLFVVPLDGIGAWYRFHDLFTDVLRARLAGSVTEVELDELHRRAALWLEDAGHVEDAVRHAIAGHDWDRAVGLLEDRCARLFALDHVAALRDCLHGLPDPIFARSPRLAFWLAWALGRTGRWADGEQPLRFAEAAWTKTGDRAGRGSLLLWEACRALYGFDNLRAIDFAERALALFPEDRSTKRILALATQGIAYVYHGEPAKAEQAFADLRILAASTGQTWYQLFEMAHSAGALIQRGRLQEAAILCRRVIQAAGDRPVEIWVQAALYHLGSIHLEWGKPADALECFRRADQLAEMTGAIQWRGRICVGLARIAWARGEREDALEQLDRARGFATRLGNEQEVRTIGAWRARFWLASNELSLARQWAESFGSESSRSREYERQIEDVALVRFLIRDGRSELALTILEAIRRQAEAAGRNGELVELWTLGALADAAAGNADKAVRSLHRALELGSPGGYARVFLDEGERLVPLLRQEAMCGDHRAYVQRLLADVHGTEGGDQAEPPGSSDILSERESEVLRLVAAGLSNRDVGDRLFISEKTVKKHMNNVLRKLGAANRTHAVERARQFGLI